MNTGDYIKEIRGKWTGLILSSDYRRSHQYLERELYYSVLVVDSAGKNRVIEVPAYECKLLTETLD